MDGNIDHDMDAHGSSDSASDASDSRSEEEDNMLRCVAMMMTSVVVAVAASLLDRRALREPNQEIITVRSDYWKKMKAARSRTAYRRTVMCTLEAFDALCRELEPRYYAKYGQPARNSQYPFDMGLAALLTYYGNGCGLGGDGIGGAAAQIGMSRTRAGVYIRHIERLLQEIANDVIYFPTRDNDEEWRELMGGFNAAGGLFPNVACVFDGTILRMRRPKGFQVCVALTDSSII